MRIGIPCRALWALFLGVVLTGEPSLAFHLPRGAFCLPGASRPAAVCRMRSVSLFAQVEAKDLPEEPDVSGLQASNVHGTSDQTALMDRLKLQLLLAVAGLDRGAAADGLQRKVRGQGGTVGVWACGIAGVRALM